LCDVSAQWWSWPCSQGLSCYWLSGECGCITLSLQQWRIGFSVSMHMKRTRCWKFRQVNVLRMGTVLFWEKYISGWKCWRKARQVWLVKSVWGDPQHQPVMRNWKGQSCGSETEKSLLQIYHNN
jgi:hypothetical protein